MPASEPVAVIGRYALHDEIASGGMATVHLGRLLGPVGFARTVAIKRLHQHYAKDPEFVSMFLDEARLAARIRHPNVVPTLDVVALSGELFLVMEYVHGVSLSKLMRAVAAQGGRIPVEVVASIMVGALHGLHAAHEARSERGLPLGIVHRDVSPQNVMVGSDGLSRVLDFGVAKASWRIQTTRDGQVKGKLSYMAPEQVNGGEIGPWTDVYSAAVVFWEALANQRLFNSSDNAAILARFTKSDPVPPPSVHNREVLPGLDQVVTKGLEAEAKLRFGSAHEMADAIEANVQLASSSAVARWVQGVVQSELDHFSEVIAEIENSSSISVRPSNGETPSVRKMLASVAGGRKSEALVTKTSETLLDGTNERSSKSVISMTGAPRASHAPGPGQKRLLQLGAGLGALAFVIASIMWLTRSSVKSEPAAQLAAASEVAPRAVQATPVPSALAPPTTPNPAAAVSADAAASAVASAPSLPATVAAPQNSSAPTPRSSRVSVTKSGLHAASPANPGHAAVSCNPPYVVDSRGIRHMKLACLR
jgi:serine/threonine protein kinase